VPALVPGQGEKAGVRDRRALVRRLFLDVLYPSLFG
jgi:hypothetical protein